MTEQGPAPAGYTYDTHVSKVTVEVKDGKIASVTVGDNSETQGIGSKTAKSDYTDKFLGQSLDTLSVDSITGATYSSKAVKTAVENALSAFEALQKEGK